jgi:uncharacterized membrane protein
MTERDLHPLARDYLARLSRAGRHLPAERLHELVSEIEEHLAETAPPDALEHEVLGALERLGPPGDIVEAEQPLPQMSADRRGLREWAAVILLPLGGFAFGIGWLVGLILLWSSRLWTTRDKLIGTLIVPGGLAIAPFVLVILGTSTTSGSCSGYGTPVNPLTGQAIGRGSFHCTQASGPSTTTTVLHVVLAVILILGPIASAIYLARRARHSSPPLVPAGY